MTLSTNFREIVAAGRSHIDQDLPEIKHPGSQIRQSWVIILSLCFVLCDFIFLNCKEGYQGNLPERIAVG